MKCGHAANSSWKANLLLPPKQAQRENSHFWWKKQPVNTSSHIWLPPFSAARASSSTEAASLSSSAPSPLPGLSAPFPLPLARERTRPSVSGIPVILFQRCLEVQLESGPSLCACSGLCTKASVISKVKNQRIRSPNLGSLC